jgi:hypothetical protein
MKRVVAVHLKLRSLFPRISKEERRDPASAACLGQTLQRLSLYTSHHSRMGHELETFGTFVYT